MGMDACTKLTWEEAVEEGQLDPASAKTCGYVQAYFNCFIGCGDKNMKGLSDFGNMNVMDPALTAKAQIEKWVTDYNDDSSLVKCSKTKLKTPTDISLAGGGVKPKP